MLPIVAPARWCVQRGVAGLLNPLQAHSEDVTVPLLRTPLHPQTQGCDGIRMDLLGSLRVWRQCSHQEKGQCDTHPTLCPKHPSDVTAQSRTKA